MRVERIIYSFLILSAALIAIVNWRKAKLFAFENSQLRMEIDELDSASANSSNLIEIARVQTDKLRATTTELMQLRNEVTQLRSGAKAVDPLLAENQRLKAEVAQMKSGALSTSADGNERSSDHFPRSNWAFSGYQSPEAALVSAIWAMKEGNPQSYLESLSPQEQERMAQVWQDKSESAIAEKHKNDVSSIAGLRVLQRENVSQNEVVMQVYLEGPGRVEKIRMNQIGQDWKFGGFIREQQAP